jgi:hypothetical protein
MEACPCTSVTRLNLRVLDDRDARPAGACPGDFRIRCQTSAAALVIGPAWAIPLAPDGLDNYHRAVTADAVRVDDRPAGGSGG